MGATPKWALLALALPDSDRVLARRIRARLLALADAHGVELVGGDTTRGPLNLCVTILGEIPAGRPRRAGARAGDDIYVSGQLGDAALAVAARAGRIALDAAALAACCARLDRPAPRVALGARLRGVANAMLDVSDGLTGDLGHILDSSAVGAVIDLESVPRSPALAARLAGTDHALARQCLLAGGDDYELCFTAAPAASRADRGNRARAWLAVDAHRGGGRRGRAARPGRAGRGDRVAARLRSLCARRGVTTVHPTLGFLVRTPPISSRSVSAPAWRPLRPAPSGRWWRCRSRRRCGRTPAMSASSSRSACCLPLASGHRAVTGRDLGVPDHGAIVWDEVVAFLLVLYFVGATTCALPSPSCCSACSTS